MRLAVIVVILILCATLANAIQGKDRVLLPQTLPGMGGPDRPMVYELGGVGLLAISLWGWGRLKRLGKDED